MLMRWTLILELISKNGDHEYAEVDIDLPFQPIKNMAINGLFPNSHLDCVVSEIAYNIQSSKWQVRFKLPVKDYSCTIGQLLTIVREGTGLNWIIPRILLPGEKAIQPEPLPAPHSHS